MNRKLLLPSLWALISSISLLGMLQKGALALEDEGNGQEKGIANHFKGEEGGVGMLVVEDQEGNRVKNLVFDHPVQAGDNFIYWEGSSMTGIAAPGTYRVRGIFHEGITPHLEYSIYSPGRPPWPTADGTGAWLADHASPASALFLPEGSPSPAKDPQPIVLLGADTAEAGNALMWVNLDCRKLSGTNIRGWNGGIAPPRGIGSPGQSGPLALTVFVCNPAPALCLKK